MKRNTNDIVEKARAREICLSQIEAGMEQAADDYDRMRLDEALDRLYELYGHEGIVPTKAALAEALRKNSDDRSKALANVIEEMRDDPFLLKRSKRRAIIAGVIAGAIVLAAICGVAYVVTDQMSGSADSLEPSVESYKVKVDAKDNVSVKAICEGWDEKTSTPIVLAVYKGDVKDDLLSEDEDAKIPEALCQVELSAGEEMELMDINEAGFYTLVIVGSPVLEDGTMFTVPDPQVVEYDGGTGQLVTFVLKKKEADEVTDADVEAAKAAAAAVGADVGKVPAVTGNALNGGSSSSSSDEAGSNSSGGTASGTDGNSGSAGSGAASHTHSWVAQTKTVHHDAVYRTVHHDAVYDSVVVCSCGVQNPGREHEANHLMNHDIYNTSVETVVVQEAWDEQVLVSEAYDETVTTGYRCSSCGAVK